MLLYLFIITIAYELFDVIRMLYKIRANSWTPSELKMVPDLSHRLANLAVASVISMGFIAGAFAGIFAGEPWHCGLRQRMPYAPPSGRPCMGSCSPPGAT